MHVIILAAGLATRLNPLSKRIPKPLIDINGKSIISRIIESFKDAGLKDFVVVTGYKSEFVKENLSKVKGVNIDFVQQMDQEGMADALFLSLDFLLKKEGNIPDFFLSAADILFSPDKLKLMLDCFKNVDSMAILSLMESEDEEIARGHGNVNIVKTENNIYPNFKAKLFSISDVIEKPQPSQILSNFYSLPLYIFKPKIYDFLQKIKPSIRGEKELQDAIKMIIKEQATILGVNIIDELITRENIGKYHLTYLNDIKKMNFRFLSGIFINTNLKGFPRIFEPIFIENDVKIDDGVVLGPNVIIKKGAHVKGECKIIESILYEKCFLGSSSKLTGCIVDEDTNIPPHSQFINKYIFMNESNNLLSIDL